MGVVILFAVLAWVAVVAIVLACFHAVRDDRG